MTTKPETWVVFDPHCATRGGEIVARNFKSKEGGERWLHARTVADEAGYAGCIVIPKSEVHLHTGVVQ